MHNHSPIIYSSTIPPRFLCKDYEMHRVHRCAQCSHLLYRREEQKRTPWWEKIFKKIEMWLVLFANETREISIILCKNNRILPKSLGDFGRIRYFLGNI